MPPSLQKCFQAREQWPRCPWQWRSVRICLSWVAPVVHLMARAYVPTDHVISQLNMVHRVALDLTTWHLTMPTLALPASGGGMGQVGLGAYV